jgi:hypothetical protein
MGQTLTIRLNEELSSWLEETAAHTGVSQGQIVREQLTKAKAAKRNRSFMRLAGSVHGLPKNLSQRKGFARA